MDRLQLATLLSWAGNGGIRGRKRLQKVVFFLQQAGCPLDCQFTLHHFGPYSRDVADTCDGMVAADLAVERGGPATGEKQYDYTLRPEIAQLVEQTPDVRMQPFHALGTELIHQSMWPLELGSTILYFYRQTEDWDHALSRACEFKGALPQDSQSAVALQLAMRVQGHAKG